MQNILDQINLAIKRHWYKVAFLVCVAILINYKDLNVNIQLNASTFAFFKEYEKDQEVVWFEEKNKELRPVNASNSAQPRNISQLLNKKKPRKTGNENRRKQPRFILTPHY